MVEISINEEHHHLHHLALALSAKLQEEGIEVGNMVGKTVWLNVITPIIYRQYLSYFFFGFNN